jgi:hypothetical protein
MQLAKRQSAVRRLGLAVLLFLCAGLAVAQDTVTGAFEGTVTDSQTGEPIAQAAVVITNQATGVAYNRRSDARGRFFQGLLTPGVYKISVASAGYETREVLQTLKISYTGEVVPVPVALDPATPGATPTPTPAPGATPGPTPAPSPALRAEDTDLRAGIGGTDGARRGSFSVSEAGGLPLGGVTTTRTFDELALLTPGVAPPPPTRGSGAGPGVGAGVGTSGQFAVNGLRSRANNFTVDGSDNNDEDIGVRRQGFVALVPQPIESIQEYQIIAGLAPAQFGRNLGAQVNAVSKSGGREFHGSVFGFFNSEKLNARNFFDTRGTNAAVPVMSASGQRVLDCGTTLPFFCPPVGRPITSAYESGGEDSFTFAQSGVTLGGPLARKRRTFFFASLENQFINASQEQSFAVPTIEQRGVANTGATGLCRDPFNPTPTFCDPNVLPAYPTNIFGDTIFSLFPFPNNPAGVYGRNTFTQTLPAGGRGLIASGKIDHNWDWNGREQSFTGRYNFTQDGRDIGSVGEALFASLRARVRTQNLSLFYNSRLNAPDARRNLFNQLRLSYGRTRLNFRELRDTTFLRPSSELPNEPFLLNAPIFLNSTSPNLDASGFPTGPNTGPVFYNRVSQNGETEDVLGPVGQVNIAGFSPIGTDVFNFPQNRVNNTYQLADNLSVRAGNHAFTFGADTRRTDLNSFLPRNARPLITFNGAPELDFNDATDDIILTNRFIRPETFAAAAAASGFSQTLARRGETAISLRYYQLNFFAQDEWRMRPGLSLSLGLRYEHNTPPRERRGLIEDSFDDPDLSVVPGLRRFIAGRDEIFKTERSNFAPRLGLAFSPNLFGNNRASVFRAGYGIFYDQILGAVVSQSRNVYPDFLTLDLAGGLSNLLFISGNGVGGSACPFLSLCPFELINPQITIDPVFGVRLVRPGTLNTLNPALTVAQIRDIGDLVSGQGIPPQSGFGATLPAPRLATPTAQHYSLTFEQQLTRRAAFSVAYAGTQGRHLLRFTTPNLGRNAFLVPVTTAVGRLDDPFFFASQPFFYGVTLPPGFVNARGDDFASFRPVADVGAIDQFETTANSRYDALQAQFRFRARAFNFNAAYTFSRTDDDVSDVFDLAGASALPQNNFNLRAERGPASFDARHRFTYYFVYDLPSYRDSSPLVRAVLGGLQITSGGQAQSGLPFTVNSIFDVNFDGNLTDRLDNENGLARTGDGRQPLRLTTANTQSFLAAVGRDGRLGRNSFRAGGLLNLDAALAKRWPLARAQQIQLRVEVFNLTNRDNFGLPVRFLEAPGFGAATDTATPARRVQFTLKYLF